MNLVDPAPASDEAWFPRLVGAGCRVEDPLPLIHDPALAGACQTPPRNADAISRQPRFENRATTHGLPPSTRLPRDPARPRGTVEAVDSAGIAVDETVEAFGHWDGWAFH